MALAELRAEVEARVREMQMRQEQERLERLIDEADEAQSEALLALMAWLPQFEQQLKRRAR